MFLLDALQWLQDQSLPTAIRESSVGYPLIETSHVVSIILFAGLVMMMDLRLVGLAYARTPFSRIQMRLFPWQMVGFALSSFTGVLLFLIDPRAVSTPVRQPDSAFTVATPRW